MIDRSTGSCRLGTYDSVWSLEQIHRLFFEEEFFTWARNTIIVTVFSTTISVTLSALGAYALARLKFRGADTLSTRGAC